MIQKFAFILCLFFVVSCGSDSSIDAPSSQLPGVTGRVGELVVVIPESQWQGPIGDALMQVLEYNYPVLPQYEPRLNLKPQTWERYKKYYMRHRNVLIINVQQVIDNREVKTIQHKKTNANGQLVYEIICRTQEEFIEELNRSAPRIIEEIEAAEIKREFKTISRKRNRSAEKNLAKDYQIDLVLPSIFSISEEKEDFIWIQGPSYTGKKGATQEGILIYFTDYINDSLFSPEVIMDRRDTILRKNVPGPEIGSYMGTQYHPDYAPQHRVTEINGRYSHEVKGIWRIKNGASMAGPFVSITTLDEERNRLVTIEGYVFAPGEKKKPLIRRMEAIIKTINFTSSELEDSPSDR